MAYKRFDDPVAKVDDSKVKVSNQPDERIRRAFQSLANRVVGGTSGTGHVPTLAGAAVATSAGFKTANNVGVIINGVMTTCGATDNLFMPEGTQGTSTIAKYLIYTNDGTSGSVAGPGNVVSINDYTTVALATVAAKLPDLPADSCALAQVTVAAPSATVLAFDNAAGYKVGTGGTTGTATYVDLVCMPYEEV